MKSKNYVYKKEKDKEEPNENEIEHDMVEEARARNALALLVNSTKLNFELICV